MAPSMDAPTLDRAAGALVGLAAGDALGAGYEFGPPTSDPRMIGGGLGGWEPGEWTDDTQMAICIAEEAATGVIEPNAAGDRFLDWLHKGPKDVGIQTQAVLSKCQSGKDLEKAAAEYFKRHPHSSAGNGSLMRTAPVALAHLGNDDAITGVAARISALTHGDPLAGEACILWCIAIDRAVRDARLDGIREGLARLSPASRDRWAGLLDEAEDESRPLRSFAPNGFVVTALQAAHAAVTRTPIPDEFPCRHLQDALRAAAAIGDDTDTVAAIAGSLLGARWGASAVPLEWSTMLHGWPGYQVRDLTRLAVLAARGGQADSAGWPSAASMAEHYFSKFALDESVIELPDDRGVLIGGFGGLRTIADKADVVVSLCRVGADDIPDDVERVEPWLIDMEGENPNLDFLLSDLAGAICTWRDEGKTVYVHCVRSESRTPTVAAAYIAERHNLSGSQALRRVYEVLPDAEPRLEFVDALERIWT